MPRPGSLALGILFLLLALTQRGGAAPSPEFVTVVDVLVVHTGQAREAAGGTASVEAQVQQAFLEANAVFQNSRAQVRVRLVQQQEISYAESGSATTDLERLRVSGDGWLDQVHAWRDATGADLVCLVTETGSDWDFYGLQGPSAANAFSVLRRPFLTGFNYLPVTLSFNFGCQLDRPHADSLAAYPFSFGHTFYLNESHFGTVEGFSASVRLPWFSNPEILHQGMLCGVPVGQAYASDNTRTLNLTAPIVAAFRGGAASTLPPTVSLVSPATNAVISTASQLVLTATTADVDGFVTRVEFFANGQPLGSAQTFPFTYTVTNTSSGPHRLMALAIDNQGASSVSEPLDIVLLPGNDGFAQRVELAGDNLSVAANTLGATSELGEPRLGNGRSLWWSWTAHQTGVVEFSLPNNGSDWVLGTFAGETPGGLVPLDPLPTGLPITRVPVVAGQTIQIGIADAEWWGADSHPLTLHIRFLPKPPNDDFADATVLTGTDLTIAVNTAGATNEPGEPFSDWHSVWWRWTAPQDGAVIITTAYPTSQFPQWVGAFTGNSVTHLTIEGSSFAGYVMFHAVAGTVYHLATDGSGEPFTLTLRMPSPPANDHFEDATLLSGDTIAFPATTLAATVEAGEPEHVSGTPPSASVWFRWVSPEAGVAQLGYLAASVGVYTGTSLSNLVKVASRNFVSLSFPTIAGATYFIVVADAREESSAQVLDLVLTRRAPNDSFTTRISVAGELFTVTGSNTLATVEIGEPSHDPANLSGSVWWTWTAPRDGVTTLHGFAVGPRTIPVMAVYTGGDVTHLTCIASNAAAGTLHSHLFFNATSGTTYQIALAGDSGQEGELGFTLDMASFRITSPSPGQRLINPTHLVIVADAGGIGAPFDRVEFSARSLAHGWAMPLGTDTNAPYEVIWSDALYLGGYDLIATAFQSNQVVLVSPPVRVYFTPANDDFTNAIILEGDEPFASGSPSGGTAESGEPGFLSVEKPSSIWWRWTAPADGILDAYFDGVGYGTGAGIYQGSNLTHLSHVGSVGGGFGQRYPFFVARDSTNFVRMTGLHAAGASTIRLLFAPSPPADHFEVASPILSNRYRSTFASLTATREPDEPQHGGLTNGAHSAWWKWVAPANGRAFPLANGPWPPTKPGIGLGVYTGATLGALTTVTQYQIHGPDTFNFSAPQPCFDAIAGQAYFIAMDSADSAFWHQTFQFSFVPWMTNDSFADRQMIAGLSAIITGDSFLATSEPGETALAGFGDGKSLWWAWTAPTDGVLRLSSARSPTKPLMAVYQGESVSNLVLLAATQVRPSDGLGIWLPNVDTNLTVETAEGETYLMAVDALAGTGGGEFIIDLSFTSLRISTPATDFAGLAPTNVYIAGSFTETIDGALTRLDFLAGTNVIGSGSAPGFDFIWSNAPPGRHWVRLMATNAAGNILESYPRQIAIGLSVNDTFAARISLTGSTGQLEGNNIGATRESGEPSLPGALGQTLWWSWTASANGSGVLSIPTNATFRPVLGVFAGPAVTNLSLVASNSYLECDDSVFGVCRWRQRDQLAFDAVDGTTYFIAVDGYTHEVCTGGGFTLNGEFNVDFNFWPVPANDPFAVPTVLTGSTVTLTNVNLGATRELGELAHDGNPNARSVWYQWTPPFSGKAHISGETVRIPTSPVPVARSSELGVIVINPRPPEPCTRFSENPPVAFVQPVWSVFSGSILTNLTPIAAGTNVQFDTIAGQPVNIAVSGPEHSSGAFVMRLQLVPRPTNDNFADRLPLYGATTSHAASNSGATRELGEPHHGFGTNQLRSVWWTWTAPASGTVRIRALAHSWYWTGSWWSFHVDNLCVRTYLGGGLNSLVPLTAQDDFGAATFHAEAGATYQLAVVTGIPGVEFEGEFTIYLDGPPAAPQVDALNSRSEPDGAFRLGVAGQTGQSFVLQASSDLLHWDNLTTDTILGSLGQVLDVDAKTYPHRIYRAVPLDSLLARQPLRIRSVAARAGSVFELTLQGNPGEGYLIEASTNLFDWIGVGSGIISGNSVEWFDPDSLQLPERFYRLLPVR
jgi:hypothetical protein